MRRPASAAHQVPAWSNPAYLENVSFVIYRKVKNKKARRMAGLFLETSENVRVTQQDGGLPVGEHAKSCLLPYRQR